MIYLKCKKNSTLFGNSAWYLLLVLIVNIIFDVFIKLLILTKIVSLLGFGGFISVAKQNSFLPDVKLGSGRGNRPPERERWPHISMISRQEDNSFKICSLLHSYSQGCLKAHVSYFPHQNPAWFEGWMNLYKPMVAKYQVLISITLLSSGKRVFKIPHPMDFSSRWAHCQPFSMAQSSSYRLQLRGHLHRHGFH